MPQVVTNQTTINILKRMPNQLKIVNNAIQKENSLAVRQKPLTNLKNHFIFLKMFLKSSMLIELMNVQLNNL